MFQIKVYQKKCSFQIRSICTELTFNVSRTCQCAHVHRCSRVSLALSFPAMGRRGRKPKTRSMPRTPRTPSPGTRAPAVDPEGLARSLRWQKPYFPPMVCLCIPDELTCGSCRRRKKAMDESAEAGRFVSLISPFLTPGDLEVWRRCSRTTLFSGEGSLVHHRATIRPRSQPLGAMVPCPREPRNR